MTKSIMNRQQRNAYNGWRLEVRDEILQTRQVLEDTIELNGNNKMVVLQCTCLSHIYNKNKTKSFDTFRKYKIEANNTLDYVMGGTDDNIVIASFVGPNDLSVIEGESEQARKLGENIMKNIKSLKTIFEIAIILDAQYGYWK